MLEELNYFLEKKEDTLKFGEKIGTLISPPALICLVGDLGAGKTFLTKGIGKSLNISEEIVSPSFTLINEYGFHKGTLYHCDLYRLVKAEEILFLGLEDYMASSDSIIVIEWAERLREFDFFDNSLIINIEYYKNGRNILLKSNNPRYIDIIKELKSFVDTWN